MAEEIIMPKWGLSMREGLICRWFKQEGEPVQAGETLLEIETEKMTNVVEAPATGVLARILCPAGSTVPVQTLLAVITAPGEPVPERASPPTQVAAAMTEMPSPRATTNTAPTPIIPATPIARRIARERGLDLAAIHGTGPHGTITREDVDAALTAPPPPAQLPVQKVSFFSDGVRLDGIVYLPPSLAAGQRRPAVVLCPGFTYIKSLVMPDIARVLNQAGYVALIFDYRGFGDSDGPRFRLLPSEQVADVRAAVTCVLDQPNTDPNRVAVLGLSLGGSNAVAAAGLDDRIAAVVAVEAVGAGGRWLHELRRHWEWAAFRTQLAEDRSARTRSGHSARVDPLDIVLPDPASRAFLEAAYTEFPQMRCDLALETAEALIEFEPELLADRIAPRPALFIHGDRDRFVPPEESHHLFARAGEPKRLELVSGASHFDWVLPGSAGFHDVTSRAVVFLHEFMPV
jgi:pimeloyl-ACP methyl ester carboxylesterase